VGRVLKGSVITFRASPNNGAIFNGWSQDKPLSEGGKLLSREEQFTMTMKANVNIYANYDDSKVPKIVKKDPQLPPVVKPDKKPQGIPEIPRNELVQIVYSANGGVCSDGSELFGTDFCIDYHEMPNSLPERVLCKPEISWILKNLWQSVTMRQHKPYSKRCRISSASMNVTRRLRHLRGVCIRLCRG
jgi:hypothetical protein